METCIEPTTERPTGATLADRWGAWIQRWAGLRESVDSEWNAAYAALSGRGIEPIRKWLGWALYRLAARVNPEIRD